MQRLCLTLAMMIAALCFAGCGCSRSTEPRPLDAEQERQFEEQLREVEEQERAHFQEDQEP